MRLTRSSRTCRRRTPVVAASIAAVALVLTSCNSDDPIKAPASVDPDTLSKLSSMMGAMPAENMDGPDTDFGNGASGDDDFGEEATGDEDAADDVQQDAAPTIEWKIPAEPVDERDGWKRSVVARADSEAAANSYISFAVPA